MAFRPDLDARARLVAEHRALADAIGGIPSHWACHRFARKLREQKPLLDACLDRVTASLRAELPEYGRDLAIDASDLPAAAAWAGLALGFVSLYLMQTVVRRIAGALNAWFFALAVLALSSFGIYLGRFQRWNSWDLFLQPRSLLGDIWLRVANPIDFPHTVAVTALSPRSWRRPTSSSIRS